MEVKIGVSARHVHLTKETLEKLFGVGYELSVYKYLSQTGEFASNSVINVKTEKGEFKNVRILGPLRNYNQVEISKTDSFRLGINPPVRVSGNLVGSASVILSGPNGDVLLNEGCIIAERHIHITKEKRRELGLMEVDKVKVKLFGNKAGIIDNVNLKESDTAVFELHLDTDDANAHLINQNDEGYIIAK